MGASLTVVAAVLVGTFLDVFAAVVAGVLVGVFVGICFTYRLKERCNPIVNGVFAMGMRRAVLEFGAMAYLGVG